LKSDFSKAAMLKLSDHCLQSLASNSRRALASNRLAAHACALEAMRTQVCANQCMENGSLRSFRDLLTVPRVGKRPSHQSAAQQSRAVLYQRPNVACFDLDLPKNTPSKPAAMDGVFFGRSR
jgi:hypothetical protein